MYRFVRPTVVEYRFLTPLVIHRSVSSVFFFMNYFFHRSRPIRPSIAHLTNCRISSSGVGNGYGDSFAYEIVMALNNCARSSSSHAGRRIHCQVLKTGFLFSNQYIATALLDVYCKCKRYLDADNLFDEMPIRNVVAWNSMIHGYSRSEFPVSSLELLGKMGINGMSPTAFTLSSVVSACAIVGDVKMGMAVHSVSLKRGLWSNVVVGTALINAYAKCFYMDEARRVFEEMEERNVLTWTSLIDGYVAMGKGTDEVMYLTKMMMGSSDVRLNAVTCTTVLTAFCGFEELRYGRQIHSVIVRQGLESNPYVSTALTTMYSKCAASADFAEIAKNFNISTDLVSRNSVITGLVNMGRNSEALDRFVEMRRTQNVSSDDFTFGSLLKAIGALSALDIGTQIHGLCLKTGFGCSICVGNGLISMYGKCGGIAESQIVFYSMEQPDLVSWNSLLSGYAHQGRGEVAVQLFDKMLLQTYMKPDKTTFLSVLSACSHAGYVEKGIRYFQLMKQMISSTPEIEHYGCMIDLLGRAGYLDEAEALMNDMPFKPGPSVYRALLSACMVHGNVEIGRRAAGGLLKLCPDDCSPYALLSNVFAGKSHWSKAALIHRFMDEKGIKKKPGLSRIGS
ncbi:putative Pentatricopeptide repeat-containing protein [Zostera marina]|uniref:Putative Pentatricopeptide repeat-containing protein n=1 Tax=Zostera marina TaxID=29655 RepID=A0A0K9NKA3_ZOSMR|nr:putative Pentatricopeptide repeat-containing protein [Zostera marina]